MKTELLTAKADFDKAIDGVARKSKALDAEIQHIGLSAIAHNEAHHDPVYINRLWLALGKGHRKGALTQWLLQFAAVSANTGEDKKLLPFVNDKTKTTDVAAASIKPWFDFKPEPGPDVEVDVRKLVLALLERVGKNTAGVKEDQVGFLAELRDLAERDIETNG